MRHLYTAFSKPDTAPKGTEHLVWVFILMSCPKMQRDFHSFLLNRSHHFRSWLLKNAVKWFQSKQAEKSCNSPLTYLLNSLKSVRARFAAYLWGCTHNAIYRDDCKKTTELTHVFHPVCGSLRTMHFSNNKKGKPTQELGWIKPNKSLHRNTVDPGTETDADPEGVRGPRTLHVPLF